MFEAQQSRIDRSRHNLLQGLGGNFNAIEYAMRTTPANADGKIPEIYEALHQNLKISVAAVQSHMRMNFDFVRVARQFPDYIVADDGFWRREFDGIDTINDYLRPKTENGTRDILVREPTASRYYVDNEEVLENILLRQKQKSQIFSKDNSEIYSSRLSPFSAIKYVRAARWTGMHAALEFGACLTAQSETQLALAGAVKSKIQQFNNAADPYRLEWIQQMKGSIHDGLEVLDQATTALRHAEEHAGFDDRLNAVRQSKGFPPLAPL